MHNVEGCAGWQDPSGSALPPAAEDCRALDSCSSPPERRALTCSASTIACSVIPSWSTLDRWRRHYSLFKRHCGGARRPRLYRPVARLSEHLAHSGLAVRGTKTSSFRGCVGYGSRAAVVGKDSAPGLPSAPECPLRRGSHGLVPTDDGPRPAARTGRPWTVERVVRQSTRNPKNGKTVSAPTALHQQFLDGALEPIT